MSISRDIPCYAILHGLPRSFRWTQRNIIRNVLEPFRQLCGSIHIIAHFNLPDRIDNARSLEMNVRSDFPDMSRLSPDMLLIERQRDETVQAKFEILRHHDLCAETTLGSHRNLLHGYHSLRCAWELAMTAQMPENSIVLMLRSDLDYIDRWPADELVSMIVDQGLDLITPDWHAFTGLNDRMAVASYAGAQTYAGRWDKVEHIVEEGVPRSSEQILLRCAEFADLRLATFSARALRVRADGRTVKEDFSFPFTQRARWKLRHILARTGNGALRHLSDYLA